MSGLNLWLVGGGMAVGAVFAVIVQPFRFCMVAGTSNLLLIKDYRQALAFAVTLLIGISGTQLLEMFDMVAIAESSYRNHTLDWFGASVGGFIFGIGATLAGGCAARTIVKSMEGSMHSLLALVSFALVASITQFGFLESVRLSLTEMTSVELVSDAGIATILGLPQWLVLAVVAVILLLFIFKGWKQSTDKTMLGAGIIIGLLVVTSWYITGVLAQDEFDPTRPSAITVSGPMARFGYIILSGRIPAFSFSISFVIGTAVVSLVLAIIKGQFKITPPNKGMAKMAVLGGALMGIGAIMAYGCNIGQGLSGISTLSLESLLAVVGMVAGIAVMTKQLEKTA